MATPTDYHTTTTTDAPSAPTHIRNTMDDSSSDGEQHGSSEDEAMADAQDDAMDSDDSREDFMDSRNGLDARFNVDEARSDPDDSDDDSVIDRFDRRYDVYQSRWIFVGRYFEDWFSTVDYENQDGCSYMAVRFDCFKVQLPFTTAQSQASDAYLQRLRDATELVGLMLRMDINAWQFVKKKARPGFRHFHVSSYDPEELVPKMTFRLSQRWGNEPDQPDAIQRLRFMLLDCDREASPRSVGGAQFRKNKARILALDTDGQLRGYKIPIAIQLTPREPTEATGVEPLRVYLREAIALVKDLLVKEVEENTSFPFRLVEVCVSLWTTRVSDVMRELRELKSLGVAVKIRMRHSRVGSPWRINWSELGQRDNVYPLLSAEAPGSDLAEPVHSFNHGAIVCSVPQLSAVASASTLAELVVDLQTSTEVQAAVIQAQWLAYALLKNRGLRMLELRSFTITNKLLDAMQAVVEARDPARLLCDQHEDAPSIDTRPQFVRLKPGASISTDNQDPRTLEELEIPLDWEFAVVSTQNKPATIEFVVPGYGIGSAAETDVDTITVAPAELHEPPSSQLTTLVLEGSRPQGTPVHRFLQLFGRSLEHLRWSMTGNQPLIHDELERDLASAFTTCPHLTSFSLESAELSSFAVFIQRFQSIDCKLRSLAFLDLTVPESAMLELFATLSDPATRLARTLDELYVFNQDRPLNGELAEAALQMLRTNTNLSHLTLCLEQEIFASYKLQFQAVEEELIIKLNRLPMANKLAFLSAQQHHHTHDNSNNSALGRLDSSCVTLVFEFAATSGRRRIQIFREGG